MTPVPVVVAVDGGGSKTDVVVLTLDGEVLERRRGPGSSPDLEGVGRSVAIIDAIVREAVGDHEVRQAGVYLSGLDLPIEVERYVAMLDAPPWSECRLTVENDLFALLRAGTDEPDAVVVVCGTGINALGTRADGRVVRFPALGTISGDWGGGYDLGAQALWHAARAVDGRGPETALVPAVLDALGVDSIETLIAQLHFGEREHADLARLAPAVFELSAGDGVARALVVRQGTEIVDFIRAVVNRLDLHDEDFPVVLGGGILRAAHPLLHPAIAAGVAEIAPHARVRIVREDPVVGAAALALAAAGAAPEARTRARVLLTKPHGT